MGFFSDPAATKADHVIIVMPEDKPATKKYEIRAMSEEKPVTKAAKAEPVITPEAKHAEMKKRISSARRRKVRRSETVALADEGPKPPELRRIMSFNNVPSRSNVTMLNGANSTFQKRRTSLSINNLMMGNNPRGSSNSFASSSNSFTSFASSLENSFSGSDTMIQHLNEMEEFLHVVSNKSKKERSKLLRSSVGHGAEES